ncbi:hypothetical protein MNBD_BACTEROID07-799 [hydrothermal vent metagenome]|uniref:Uncharacterized protein n=1 Tax=hydrothermal vent metagenome TaxID=652676 RepID=A0A3B0V4J1_9ZZZZ
MFFYKNRTFQLIGIIFEQGYYKHRGFEYQIQKLHDLTHVIHVNYMTSLMFLY